MLDAEDPALADGTAADPEAGAAEAGPLAPAPELQAASAAAPPPARAARPAARRTVRLVGPCASSGEGAASAWSLVTGRARSDMRPPGAVTVVGGRRPRAVPGAGPVGRWC